MSLLITVVTYKFTDAMKTYRWYLKGFWNFFIKLKILLDVIDGNTYGKIKNINI